MKKTKTSFDCRYDKELSFKDLYSEKQIFIEHEYLYTSFYTHSKTLYFLLKHSLSRIHVFVRGNCLYGNAIAYTAKGKKNIIYNFKKMKKYIIRPNML